MSDIATGRCACGEVRFRLTARPLFIHCCHCTWCQRETGSAFALNAMIERACVELVQGVTEETETPSASGKGQVISRCAACKVAVWSVYSGAGAKVLFVRVGTLDDRAAFAPDIHIYTSTKLPWVILPDDVPAVAEYYRRSQMWPAESLARRAALLAGD